MNKVIEPVNFDASPELIDRISYLFDDLDKYNDRIVSSDIYLESMNFTAPEDKRVKIRVLLPGDDIWVENDGEDFLSAAQILHDRVKRLLIDRKEKDKTNVQARPDKP